MKVLLWIWMLALTIYFPPIIFVWAFIWIAQGFARSRRSVRTGHRVVSDMAGLKARVPYHHPLPAEPPALTFTVEEVFGTRGGRA